MSPGNRLRQLRGKRRQSEVEKATGIKYYILSNYENDITQVPPDALKTLAKYYQVSTDFILFGAEANVETKEFKDWIFDNTLTLNGDIITKEEKDMLVEMSKTILLMRKQKQ